MDFNYYKMYIGGKLVDAESGEKTDVICPATGESIGQVARAGIADTNKALEAAQKGFKYWSNLSLAERTRWMLTLREEVLKNEDLLRKAMMHEMGKTYTSGEEDIEALVNSLEWYPAAMKNYHGEQLPDYENTHRHNLIYQPAGVAVAYLAWNFPILNLAFKIGPALAAGCSIILKPSFLSPVSAYILGEIMHGIDFPEGVVNIISGPSQEVATTLSKSKIPAVVTMIGSTATGLQVIADSTTSIKRLSMELGGNAPFIVFDDADIDKAVDIATLLKFNNCGQVCVAVNRVLVHSNIYDRFMQAFLEKTKNLKVGFGIEEKPDMGPLVTSKDRDRMLALINDAVSQGAKVEVGGNIPAGKDKGNWFEPTVLTGVNSRMRVFREEIFGPIAPVSKFETDEEALNMANDTEYGLSSYIFTKDHNRIVHFSEKLEFGEVQVNGVKYSIYLPHGGIKNSGIGHDCSSLALDDYLIKKRISTAIA